MSGWLAGATIGASALGVGASLLTQKGAQDYGSGQLVQAQQNYQLQKQIAEEQQRMARAGRTDALGNRVYFDGTNWVTDVTPGTKGVLLASQANERRQQVSGGIRNEIGQEKNFANRGAAGNLAASVLRELQSRAGAPSYEGTHGRDVVAAATKAGGTRDALADALARNLIRGGGNIEASRKAYDSIDSSGADNLRTGMAGVDATTPDKYINEKQAYDTAGANRYAPLTAVASNIGDTATTPTTVGAPIDASLNQAATYGAATSGRGAAGINAAGAITAGVPYSPINLGGAVGGLTNNVLAYLKQRQGSSSNDPNWSTAAANDKAYNNWQF